MDAESFWDLIKKSRSGAEDCEEQAESLTALLTELEPQEIIDFDRHLRQRRAEAYRWDMWAVAYIINGGCSDDGFEYFRGWLIAQGKEYFEATLNDPEHAADRISPGDEAECESILYVASEAYAKRTGEVMPAQEFVTPTAPTGQEWGEDEVERLYPKLAKKFGL
jgi:hypothetical protein